MGRYNELKLGEKGAWLSIIAYTFLTILKLSVAYFGHSDALRADGLNNTTDIIASAAVLIGLRISRKPPDDDHHYGHFRAETIASLIAAFIMATIGLQVIFDTFQKIVEQEFIQPNMITGWTALFSSLVMYLVYRYNVTLSKKISSSSLNAAAQDNKSDALVSIGAFIGITGAQFGLFWLDPVAGLIVGFIICKTAWDIFHDATHMLTDGFDEKQLSKIKASVAKDSDVKKVDDIKARMHGNQALVDVTILVNPNLNVQESHDITERIESLLEKKHNIYHAHIHIEPYDQKNK
ncbi:cation diffusion facilitator family transporter [Aquibacillus sp. 3ASR75-11]|uniref:Cation diffusion facilitator family transporter n=1 Tax=Terrihalobacillus insolitus TaxID=2950438 RepID=A0A9X3WRT1_9BACI|nr:cation diffusion facilitator family transporter [Terrihalobacillus insolitus]MDC3413561.1 cation diffusion facilitator family transporter [Terrihalobacillus insolitus]MDC3424682.1 cation diffusion facilitator family transporter [Terrihalobacillus insolitus]